MPPYFFTARGHPGAYQGVLRASNREGLTILRLLRGFEKTAAELKPDGLWAQISMDTNGGLIGVAKSLPQDEATLNQLMDEMNQLSQMNEAQK